MRIPVSEPLLDGNEREYVLEALDTNWISSAGKYISAFEESFAAYCDVKFGVACSSGTAALHLALASLGITSRDEVIIPNFTLIANANMVILCGAKPVLVDVDPQTMCIDPDLIEEKITFRTKAIMPVHMYGHPADMDAIMAIAEKYGLYVIEDGAEAHGTEYKGRKVGGLGHCCAFSFYGNKNLTTGEGGMVTTNSEDLAEMAALLRSQAFEDPRFVHRFVGFNYRLTNIQAAIGLAQVERAEEKVNKRRDIAAMYTSLLQDVPGITVPYEAEWAKNTFWMYGILIDEQEFGCSKADVAEGLAAAGIDTRDFFYPLHKQPVFQNGRDSRFPDVNDEYPVSSYLYENGLYLPSGLTLTSDEIEIVVEELLNLRR